MPPRWLSWIIVGFWLATTGWLFSHDLWPKWRPGEPPPFHVDLVEEVQKGHRLPTFWIVERQSREQQEPQPVFHAQTWVRYDQENDAYTLHARLETTRDPKYQPVFVAKFLKVKLITSAYCVNRAGQLVSLEATVEGDVRQDLKRFLRDRIRPEQAVPEDEASSTNEISLSIGGEVRDRQFFAHCSADATSLDKPIRFDLPSTDVSYTGSVLMPLHPINHIRGLRLGQTWRQPVVDPLQDTFAWLPGLSGGVRWLNARVLPQLESLKMSEDRVKCFVIEYTNEDGDLMGRTWVDRDSDSVLKQEAILEDGRWIMKRELQQHSRARHLDSGND